MKSDKNFGRTTTETDTPTGPAQGKLQRNPEASRSTQKLYRESTNTDVLSSSTIEFLRLAIRNGVSQTSRIMAWDNQRIFGPSLETSSSAENGDLEAE